jgi:hypothetical protein
VEALKTILPAWAVVLLVLILSAAFAGLGAWVASGGNVIATVSAIIACILGPGAWSAKSVIGDSPPKSPPDDPTATAPVTP